MSDETIEAEMSKEQYGRLKTAIHNYGLALHEHELQTVNEQLRDAKKQVEKSKSVTVRVEVEPQAAERIIEALNHERGKKDRRDKKAPYGTVKTEFHAGQFEQGGKLTRLETSEDTDAE